MKEEYLRFTHERLKDLFPEKDEKFLLDLSSQLLDFCHKGCFVQSGHVFQGGREWKDNPSAREYLYSQLQAGAEGSIDLYSLVNVLVSLEKRSTGDIGAHDIFQSIQTSLQNGKNLPNILLELGTPLEEVILIKSGSQMGDTAQGLRYAKELIDSSDQVVYDHLLLEPTDLLDEACLNEVFTDVLSTGNTTPLEILANCQVTLVKEFPLNVDYMALKNNRRHAYQMWGQLMSMGYPLIDAVKQLSHEGLPYQGFFQTLCHQLHTSSKPVVESIFDALSVYSHNEACCFYLRAHVSTLNDAVLCLGSNGVK